MRKLLFIIVAIVIYTHAQSQVNIKGILQDTLSNPLISATVLLLDQDSVMLDFTSSEFTGSFEFEDVEPGDYIVKATFLSYIPLAQNVDVQGEDIDLGTLQMTELAEELMAVVIKAAKASIVMKGDTVEYDASTFKVPEGSSVEDLLRRLPGIEVKRDGEILAEGQDVDRVTVDGKSFFGSDPKAATKNLPAEGISKVQVFDTKTEQEEITGETGQSDTKTMNLELKEAFKSGGFGKVVAGVGTESTGELKGNYNKFNDKIQFSLVGVANNTGRNGLGWDDYQDFLGSSAFNFDDGGTYGFGGGGFRSFTFGGSGNGIESSIQSIFFSGSGSGFPENYNGGTNFNFDNKKTKVNAVYFYNQNNLERETASLDDRFYDTFVRSESNDNLSDNRSDGHRGEIGVELKIDSLHKIKIDFDGAIVNRNNLLEGNSLIFEDDQLRRSTIFQNQTQMSGSLGSARVLFNKSFKKKGRKIGLNASFLSTEIETDWNQVNDLTITDDNGTANSRFDRENFDQANKNQFKFNALFVEPLSERFFFQSFFNHNNRDEAGSQIVDDVVDQQRIENQLLSSEYNNTISSNRVGAIVRYSYEGLNIGVGAAYQVFDLLGVTRRFNEPIPFRFDDSFNSFIPNASISYSPSRSTRMSLNFDRNVNEPNIEDLKGVVDFSNPNLIKFGNTSLIPEVTNGVSARFSKSSIEKGTRFNISGGGSLVKNGFSISEEVDPETLLTEYTPVNLDGGRRYNTYTSFSFPIKMNKFTIDTRLSANWNIDPTLVNGLDNESNRRSLSPGITINITPNNNYTLFIDGSYSVTQTTYSIDESLNQINETYRTGAELNAKIAKGLFISGTFDFTRYQNDRFNQTQNISIVNASIYKHLLKNNQLEIRLSIYDALNNNLGFTQAATTLGITQTTTPTLARYGMLSLAYNIRGMKSGIKKNRWW